MKKKRVRPLRRLSALFQALAGETMDEKSIKEIESLLNSDLYQGLTILEATEQFNIDTLRFHLLRNGPEKRDTSFSVEDYNATHNEVNNKLGNFIKS